MPARGVILADGLELIGSAWWTFLFPSLAIVLTVLSMNIPGTYRVTRLDPKLRNIRPPKL